MHRINFRGVLALIALASMAQFAEAGSVNTGLVSYPLELSEQAELTAAERLRGTSSKIWSAACCKVCRKGKACGDSCINRSYTCHKGKGCACDG